MTTIDYSKFDGHTPGPWDYDAPMETVYGGGGLTVADVWPEDVHDVHATGHLIAAAPALLARCKALEEALRQSEKFIRDYLRDSGGCDHSVGICECETVRLLDSVVAVLAATP